MNSILAVLWSLIKRYTISPWEAKYKSEGVDMSTKLLFLKKMKGKIESYKKDIPNFDGNSNTFLNCGMTWISFLRHWNDLIFNVDNLDKNDDIGNMNKAFQKVEEYLGIPPFIDAEDLSNKQEGPELHSIMTYAVLVMESGKKLKKSGLRGSIRRSKNKSYTLPKKSAFGERSGSLSPEEVRKNALSPEITRNAMTPDMGSKSRGIPSFNSSNNIIPRQSSTKDLASKITELVVDTHPGNGHEWTSEKINREIFEKLTFAEQMFDPLVTHIRKSFSDPGKVSLLVTDITAMRKGISGVKKRLKQLFLLNLENKERASEVLVFSGMLEALAKVLSGIKVKKQEELFGKIVRKMITLLGRIEDRASLSLKHQVGGDSQPQQQMVDILKRTQEQSPKSKVITPSATSNASKASVVKVEKPLVEKPSTPLKSPKEKVDWMKRELEEAKRVRSLEEDQRRSQEMALKNKTSEVVRLTNKLLSSKTAAHFLLLDAVDLINHLSFSHEKVCSKPKQRSEAVEALVKIAQANAFLLLTSPFFFVLFRI